MGAQWLSAQVNRAGHWHSVMPECRPGSNSQPGPATGQSVDFPLGAASFHMIPYSNRIRNGKFSINGQHYQLMQGDKHAIHGALRKLPWSVVESSTTHLICEIDSKQHIDVNWPWRIRSRITQSVDAATLSSKIEVENLGDSAMPAGVGWHPYFVRKINNCEPILTLPVNGIFPDANGDCLPDGAPVQLSESLDFRRPRLLNPDQRIDCCFSGLHDPAVIHWKQAGIKLTMQASDNCRFLVLYNPDMPHFAVEPVTNANDAFNLQAQNIDAGMQILQPGESLQAQLSIVLTIEE